MVADSEFQLKARAEGAVLHRALIDSMQGMVFTTDAEGVFTGAFRRDFMHDRIRIDPTASRCSQQGADRAASGQAT